jgi:cell division septation protein DedD
VSTNRPKTQGVARYFVLTAVVGILAGYGLGLASGWFMFKPSRQELNALRTDAEKAVKLAPATTPPPKQAPVAGPPDPNLSFYKTLPEGKVILGTGLNPTRPEKPLPAPVTTIPTHGAAPSPASPSVPQPVAKSAPVPVSQEHRDGGVPEKPTVSQAAAKSPSPATAPAPAPDQNDPARSSQLKGKYVVQVASYQSKSEAEAVRGRLIDAGFQAYIVEAVLKDKGTLYRVRVGKHLDQAAAAELAIKAGKNAIPILE